jgi:N-acetyltransferase
MDDTLDFDLQPILIGESLELRPLRPSDWNAVFAAASDPLIWALHPVRNRWQVEPFLEFFDGALASGGAFVVVDRVSGEFIGSTRFLQFDAAASEIEIGYTFLGRSHWGGDANGEMKRLMLEHAFKYVESVFFLVGPENFRSQRAVEKIGGRRDGMRAELYKGVPYESVLFRIRKADC